MPRLVEERGTVAGSYHISLSDQVATLDGYPLAGDTDEGFADALKQLSREAAAMPEDHHLVVRVVDDRPAGYKPARARLYGGQSLEPADFPRKDRPMGMAGIPVVQAPASSPLVPAPPPAETPVEAARPQHRQEGPSAGAGGVSGAATDYRWPDPVTLPPSIAPKQRRSYPSQAARPASSGASPAAPSTSLPQEAPGAAEGVSQDVVTQRRPQPVQAPETVSGAEVLSAEETVSSSPARGDHGDISDLFSNAAVPVGRRRRRQRKDLRVPARAPEPVQTEEKTTTGPVVRHQEHVIPPRSRSKSPRQPKEPPAAFLPITKDPRSLRQRLHGTGAPLVPDARTHRLAVLPQSLSLAPLEDLAMRPLTPQEKATISETCGDEFQLHVPRIPAVHYQEPDKTRPRARGRERSRVRRRREWTRRRVMRWGATALVAVGVVGAMVWPWVVERDFTAVCVDRRTGFRAEQGQCGQEAAPRGGDYYEVRYWRADDAGLPGVGAAVDGERSWPVGRGRVVTPEGQAVEAPGASR